MVAQRVEPDVIDTIKKRIDVLEQLLEQPMDKRTLEEEMPVSRSTLDRAVRELELIDLLEYDDGRYRATTCGRLAARKYRAFEREIRLLAELRPFLKHVPSSEFDLDVRGLEDADLLVPKPNDPYAMINEHVSRLEEMDHGRGLLPITGLHAYEAAHEAIVNRGARGEVVVEPGVAETWRSDPQYAELTEAMLETGRFDIHVYDGDIPYFLGVFDRETVQIGVDEDDEPRALLETDADAVRSWAEQTFTDYKKRATPLR